MTEVPCETARSYRSVPVMNILRLISVLLLLLGFAASADATGGSGYWIANEGQWEGDFQFKCEVGSTIYYVTPKGMTVDFREFTCIPPQSSGGARGGRIPSDHDPLDRAQDSVTVRGHVLQVHYVEASRRQVSSPAPLDETARGENKLPHYSNYFLGRDSTKWRSRVGHYQTVIVPEVWPGIDVEYRADQQGVETIYHVKPGADPTQIQMEYLGLDAPLRVDAQDNLILETSLGDVKEKAPFAFQQDARTQKNVDARFQVIDETRVGYDLGAFDVSKELVVDPLITSTFFSGGGIGDDCRDIKVGTNGDLIICGYCRNPDFPATPGAYQEMLQSEDDGFVISLDRSGEHLRFATLFPKSVDDLIVRDNGDLILLTGAANQEWPLTTDAMDTAVAEGDIDLGIGIMSASGDSLLYGSLLGGSELESVPYWAQDQAGRIYIAVTTRSSDFPTTNDAMFPTFQPLVCIAVCIFDPDRRALDYSTFFHGNEESSHYVTTLSIQGSGIWLGVHTYGNLPVTAGAFVGELTGTQSAYFCRIDLDANVLTYGSYLGNQDRVAGIQSIIPCSPDTFLLVGGTHHPIPGFPDGGFDVTPPDTIELTSKAFLLCATTSGSFLKGTYLGGTRSPFQEDGYAPHSSILASWFASPDRIWVVGQTNTLDFPVSIDAEDSVLGPESEDIAVDMFVCSLNRELDSLNYSTLWGGQRRDRPYAATTPSPNEIWAVGYTTSPNFPVTSNAQYSQFSGFGQGFIWGLEIETSSIDPIEVIPFRFEITTYPNPFNPATTLEFSLPATSNVELTVHDILGREVSRENLGRCTAGQHEIHINGSEWSSGIYFATLKTPSRSQTTKLLLLR